MDLNSFNNLEDSISRLNRDHQDLCLELNNDKINLNRIKLEFD